MGGKTRAGNFFEDYRIGQILDHAAPRTVSEGDRALYGAIYPTRFALYSSDPFARSCGLGGARSRISRPSMSSSASRYRTCR